jgi:lipid-A-disaccharide synthase
VWAWGKKRINAIKRIVSLMMVLFKFEEALYKKHNIPVSFIGHPLLDVVKPKTSKEEFFARFGLNLKNFTIALLPGSREKEVKQLLPIMLETAQLIRNSMGDNIQFLILRSSAVKDNIFNETLSHHRNLTVRTVSDMTYDGLASSDFAVVASGTATLETAIIGVPMVILYKVSFLTWAYLKMLIKIPYIGMVNIVAGEQVVPEFLQYNAKPKKIARYIKGVLSNQNELTRIKEELLGKVKSSLGEEGASRRAARTVADYLNK